MLHQDDVIGRGARDVEVLRRAVVGRVVVVDVVDDLLGYKRHDGEIARE